MKRLECHTNTKLKTSYQLHPIQSKIRKLIFVLLYNVSREDMQEVNLIFLCGLTLQYRELDRNVLSLPKPKFLAFGSISKTIQMSGNNELRTSMQAPLKQKKIIVPKYLYSPFWVCGALRVPYPCHCVYWMPPIAISMGL